MQSRFNQISARALFVGMLALIQSLAPTTTTIVRAQSATPARALQQSTATQPETLEALRARLAAHLAQPRFAPAAWGVKIVSLDSGKTLFEHNAEKYFNPASNAKLYTGALALNNLGADYQIKTSIYSTARPDAAGTLKGDLILYGRGDPTLAASLNGGDYNRPLEPLLAQITAAGIRKIDGDIVGDESYFNSPPFGSGWEWDDLQEYYGAEVSALSLHDNSLDLFVKPADRVGLPCKIMTGPATSFLTFMNRTQTAPKGTETSIRYYRPVGENIVYVSGRLAVDNAKGYATSIAVHNPALLFVTLLKDALAQRGIVITGRARAIDWKYREVTPLDVSKLVELGFIESPPMKEILRDMMKPSQNLYAHLLLLQVGMNRDQQRAISEGKSPAKNATNGQASAAPDPRLQTPDLNTEESGVEALTAFLNEVGVRKGDVLLEEGSGLSRRDVITPNATIALLTFMSKHKLFAIYREALPIAGVDGTLKNRMKDTAAANNVHAKTGTLRYVYALSGYVTAASGEHLAFSIMLNNYYSTDRTVSAREDLDAIPILLANFGKQSNSSVNH
jgi:D-alanyl-D-alanine carboxypeptidase/D-alanyl-D-alanine-endopeptidase (penicillin-binding protein 4)